LSRPDNSACNHQFIEPVICFYAITNWNVENGKPAVGAMPRQSQVVSVSSSLFEQGDMANAEECGIDAPGFQNTHALISRCSVWKKELDIF
jgi:hypothetical protein